MPQNSTRTVYRFGSFEADSHTGELRKNGRRLALQGQPLQVLLMLLERPGELVERGEIQNRLWPEGTFVDFDHGLNAAVNKIRDALDDSAANPRFIETLARRGYRFVGSVEVVQPAPLQEPVLAASAGASAQSADFSQEDAVKNGSAGFLTSAADLPDASHTVVRWLLLLIQVMYLSFYVAALARIGEVREILSAYIHSGAWPVSLVIVATLVGIPIRLYLISGLAFRAPLLREKFLKIFPLIFPLDEFWALAPFLLVAQIGLGLALGATAALLYVPFAERSLFLMSTAGAKTKISTS